jgi:hypothetical protein
MEDGRPAWAHAPSGSCEAGHKYTECHVLKILSDEEVPAKRKAEGKAASNAEPEDNRKNNK